jgi:hypothetical protein
VKIIDETFAQIVSRASCSLAIADTLKKMSVGNSSTNMAEMEF